MRLVIVESPYFGDRELNDRYLRACLLDCLSRGEAALASHGLYPGALDDSIPDQRDLGIAAGFAWRRVADATVVYMDLGISSGMAAGIQHAMSLGHVVEHRTIAGWKS